MTPPSCTALAYDDGSSYADGWGSERLLRGLPLVPHSAQNHVQGTAVCRVRPVLEVDVLIVQIHGQVVTRLPVQSNRRLLHHIAHRRVASKRDISVDDRSTVPDDNAAAGNQILPKRNLVISRES